MRDPAGTPADEGSVGEGPDAEGGDSTGADDGEVGEGTIAGGVEVRDSLPADLDASGYVGPYLFPNNSRRRISGVLYLVIGAASIVAVAALGADAVLINGGFVAGGAALTLLGCYCAFAAGWDLAVDENDALVVAARAVGFPVGHASAQLAWRGLRSRPTWRLLIYSNEAQPSLRGLVIVDGVDGEVLGHMVEPNPEDWTGLDA